MKRIIIISLFIIWSCNIYKKENSSINIRIKNNTTYSIENILLFNTKFKSLKPNTTGKYLNITPETIKNNAIFSLDSNGKTFNMYISNVLIYNKYTYEIDSLNFKNRYIFFKKTKN